MQKEFKDYEKDYKKVVVDIRKLNIKDYAKEIEKLNDVVSKTKDLMKKTIDEDKDGDDELEKHNKKIKDTKAKIKELKAGLEENQAQLEENRKKQEKLKSINLVNIRKNVKYLLEVKLAKIDEKIKAKEDIIKEKEQKVEELKRKNHEEHNLTDEEIKTLQDTMIELKGLKENFDAEKQQYEIEKENIQKKYDDIITLFDELDKKLESPLTKKELEELEKEEEEKDEIEEKQEEIAEEKVEDNIEEANEETIEEPLEEVEDEIIEEEVVEEEPETENEPEEDVEQQQEDIKDSKKLIQKTLEGVPNNIEFYYLPEEKKKYMYDKEEDIIYEIKREDTDGYIYCYDVLNKIDMVYDVKNNEFRPAKEEEKQEPTEAQNVPEPQPRIIIPDLNSKAEPQIEPIMVSKEEQPKVNPVVAEVAEPTINKDPVEESKPEVSETVDIKPTVEDTANKEPVEENKPQSPAEDIKPTRVMHYDVKRDAYGVTINGKFVSYKEIHNARESKFDQNKEAVERLEGLISELSLDRKIFVDREIFYAAQALTEKDSSFDIIGFAEEYNSLLKDSREALYDEVTGRTTLGRQITSMDITYNLKLKLRDIFKKDVRAKLESVKEAAFRAKKYSKIEMRGITAFKFNRRWHKEDVEQKLLPDYTKLVQGEKRKTFVDNLGVKDDESLDNKYANKTPEEMFETFNKANEEAERKFDEAVGISKDDDDKGGLE